MSIAAIKVANDIQHVVSNSKTNKIATSLLSANLTKLNSEFISKNEKMKNSFAVSKLAKKISYKLSGFISGLLAKQSPEIFFAGSTKSDKNVNYLLSILHTHQG